MGGDGEGGEAGRGEEGREVEEGGGKSVELSTTTVQ